MARVRLMKPEQPVSDFSVSGASITVKDYAVDCAQYYAAGERVIEIRADASGAAVIGGTGPYLATIKIPARQFTEGENGPVLVPLDPAAVTITLWPSA